MSKSILWLDNDYPYVRPYANALEAKGYSVTVITTVGDAERLLSENTYDLLILDVMIPTMNAGEEANYPATETDDGHKLGLLFYRRMKDKLGEEIPPVLVMTVRLDMAILDEFLSAGLERERFSTKFGLRDVSKFLNKIESLFAT